MAGLNYVGAPVIENPDLVYKDYVALVKTADKTVAQADADIASGLAGYATKDYVDAQDLKNATKGYVDNIPTGINPNGGDAARLPLSRKGLSNGSVPLDATGRVPTSRINAPLTQKYLRGPWTPPYYHSVPQPITAEATVYSSPVTDPGCPYRLVVFGHLDCRSSIDAEHAKVLVRADAAVGGEIVAVGFGAAQSSDSVVPTSGETFGNPSPTTLGPTWKETSESGSGGYYSVTGGQAVWIEDGSEAHTIRYRRIAPATDPTTLTDYQKIRVRIGSPEGEDTGLLGGSPQWIRVCGRMNTAEDQWVGMQIELSKVSLWYANGGAATQMKNGIGGFAVSPTNNQPSANTGTGTYFDLACGTFANMRQFLVYRNDVLLLGAVDANKVTAAGSGNRGWGLFGHAGSGTFFQVVPPALADLLVTDAPPSSHHISIVPAVATAVRTGATTLYVRVVRSGALSTQTVSAYRPRISIFAVPA